MKKLAQHLGLSVTEVREKWDRAGLDGDEVASLADVFGLDVTVPPDGRVSTGKISSGLAKLSAQFDEPKSKPKPKRKTRKKAAP